MTAAVTLAAVSYLQYLEISRLRWAGMAEDRNAHYLFGLNLAFDIRQWDVKNLLSDLDGARVWPPLHGILVAIALLAGGLDHRIAVLPSLVGWTGTVVLGFLVARRAVHRGGNFAGVVAAIFIVASPAHRVFATDVMLESLGACLSLLILYFYLVAAQEPTGQSYKHLGLALTALFLTKYNYWFLIVAGMLAAESIHRWRPWLDCIRTSLRSAPYKELALAELRQPLNYLALASLALMILVRIRGQQNYQVWGWTISTVGSHHNFIQVAYTVFFVRAVPWWRKIGRARLQAGDFRVHQLAVWHLWPVAIWLLLPKRVGYMLFYLSPTRAQNSPASFLWGLDYYWQAIPDVYHAGTSSAVMAAALIMASCFALRRLKPGASTIIAFVVLAALLTIAHPNRLSRYVHTWIPAAWILSGVGAATLIYRRRAHRGEPFVAAALISLLALWNLKEPFALGHSPEAGHSRLGPSALDITDYYLPYLKQSRHAALFATVPAKHLAQWTFLERYGERDRIEVFLRGFGPSREENRERFQRWVQSTRSDTIVFLDAPPGSRFYLSVEEPYAQYRELLFSQSIFEPYLQRHFPEYGCTVTLWRRHATKFKDETQGQPRAHAP